MNNLQSDLRSHLSDDENLLWTGKPKTGIIFNNYDYYMVPFSLFWCGFVIYWTYNAMQIEFIFGLFGVPFVVIGLIIVFGRFIIDAKKRENTVYGITENRIVIKSGIFSKNIESLNIKTLSNLSLREESDGTGTITLGAEPMGTQFAEGMDWWPGVKLAPKLRMIPNARSVYDRIVKLQR